MAFKATLRAAALACILMAPLGMPAPALADVKTGVDAWSRGDYVGAVAEWRGPAAQGDPDAQFNLAQAYRLGRGVEANEKQAELFYAKAAAQGHLKASDNLGLLMFQDGRRQEAMPYVRDASDRGDPRAQYLLGIAHFNGDLVEKDWVRAYALLTLANSAGLPQADCGNQADGRFHSAGAARAIAGRCGPAQARCRRTPREPAGRSRSGGRGDQQRLTACSCSCSRSHGRSCAVASECRRSGGHPAPHSHHQRCALRGGGAGCRRRSAARDRYAKPGSGRRGLCPPEQRSTCSQYDRALQCACTGPCCASRNRGRRVCCTGRRPSAASCSGLFCPGLRSVEGPAGRIFGKEQCRAPVGAPRIAQ